MVTLHFFVGTFFCLVPNTIEQQFSSPIPRPCNINSPLAGRNDKVLFRFGTNLVPNVCCMMSVEGLALNYDIFSVSWQTIICGSGDIRSTRHFENVCTGYFRPFPFQVLHISHCCRFLKHKIRLNLPFPAIL